MIQIFDIKKAKANKKINTNDKEILEEYIKISRDMASMKSNDIYDFIKN